MATAEIDEPIGRTVVNYTHASRYPNVIGRVGGVTLPFTVSMAQLVVGIAVLVVLGVSRQLWMAVVPSGFLTLVFVGAAIAVPAYSVRYGDFEGRNLAGAAVGVVTYLTESRHPLVHGRPLSDEPPERVNVRVQYVVPCPTGSAATGQSGTSAEDLLPPLAPFVAGPETPPVPVFEPPIEPDEGLVDFDEWAALEWGDAPVGERQLSGT